MSPALQRYVFLVFAALIAGVAGNALFLQPVSQSTGAARPADPAQAKAETERRQRLALDANPASASKLAAGEFEASKSDKLKPAVVPPRVITSGPRTVAAPPPEEGARRFARLTPNAALADRAGDTLPDAPEAEGDPDIIRAVQRELTGRGYGTLASDGVPGLVTRAAIMAFEHDNKLQLTGEATEKLLARILLGGGADSTPDPAAGRVRSAQAEIVMRTVQQSLAALGYQVGRIDGRAGDDTERAIREFELDEHLKPTGRVSAEVFTRLGRVVANARPQPIR